MAEERKPYNRRVHLANERTFLAWIRTSIGLMAFGFVVERFAIFIKQVEFFLQRQAGGAAPAPLPESVSPMHGYTPLVGILLVGMGALMGVLAFVRFKKVERQIEEGTYRPSFILDILLALVILSIGMFLVIYLIHNI